MTILLRPPLTRLEVLAAWKAGRLTTAEQAPEHGVPKATVNDWASRGWLVPVVDGRPRLFLTDDLYDLRHALAQQAPPRRSDGTFAGRTTPG